MCYESELNDEIAETVELSKGAVVKAEEIRARFGGGEVDKCACIGKECKSIDEGSCQKFTDRE